MFEDVPEIAFANYKFFQAAATAAAFFYGSQIDLKYKTIIALGLLVIGNFFLFTSKKIREVSKVREEKGIPRTSSCGVA